MVRVVILVALAIALLVFSCVVRAVVKTDYAALMNSSGFWAGFEGILLTDELAAERADRGYSRAAPR